MMRQEPPLRNSGARTSDWIGQAKGRAIYAYDLRILVSEAEGFAKEDSEETLRGIGQRALPPEIS